MSNEGWTFLTNHTHVLVCITRDPSATMRTIAEQVGITERAVQRIVGELVEGDYLSRTREGRRNEYHLNASRALRHRLERGTRLEDLLALLTAGTGRQDTAAAGAPSTAGSAVPR
jgi:DNA-binding MarR family transcriptional regulator